jgi:tyrosyl-tRNA synthetase
MTCPLITKADGTKFGKSEGGNIWLTADKTSVYKFYQFWLNTSDEDASRYIKIFTFLDQKTIENLIAQHASEPHLRLLQKRLAEEVTTFVHSQEELEKAIQASQILFGKSTSEDLKRLSNEQFLEVFEGVQQASVSRSDIETGLSMVDALAGKTNFLSSNGEARRELKSNAVSVNKEKVTEDFVITSEQLINNRFVLIGKGKKTNYILVVE